MACINNTEVFGLASAIYRSGYPMMDRAPTKAEYDNETTRIATDIQYGNIDNNPHIKRAIKLANAKGGGHDQFLTGIIVNFDLTFSNKAWVEGERYTFLNFISSMSTMHRVAKFNIRECCNPRVTPVIIEEVERLQCVYNNETDPDKKKEAYLDLLYNLPAGFELMAGMTTNYRCLKNIYHQRENHRLPDWHIFCDWVKTLPLAQELIIGVEA